MLSVQDATMVSMNLASTFTNPSTDPQFRIFVDGSLTANISASQASQHHSNFTLVASLNPVAAHQITVWYITDPIALDWRNLSNRWVSISSFSTDGRFGGAPAQRQRRLQIIGDSITAGNQISNECSCCKPDHSGTYGALLCEYFDANCTTLAISGKGLYTNCCDEDVTMSVLYQRSIVGDPMSLYDNNDFIPDAVLLNLGTNDQNKWDGSGAWIEDFTAAYADFLVNLTVAHGNPRLPIFCGVGPITSVYELWVFDAMNRARARGVSSLHYLNFSGCKIDGCRHPGWTGQRMMFDVAKLTVGGVLGWSANDNTKEGWVLSTMALVVCFAGGLLLVLICIFAWKMKKSTWQKQVDHEETELPARS